MYRILLALFKALSPFPRIQRLILRIANTRFLVGVVGLIVDPHGKVLLFHHTYRKKYAWGLPGGWLKRNEQPANALAREIREESGLIVEVTGPFELYAMPEFPGVEIVLMGRWTQGDFTPSEEVDKMIAVGPGELPDRLKDAQRKAIKTYFENRNIHG